MQELKPSLKVQSDSIWAKLFYKEIYIKWNIHRCNLTYSKSLKKTHQINIQWAYCPIDIADLVTCKDLYTRLNSTIWKASGGLWIQSQGKDWNNGLLIRMNIYTKNTNKHEQDGPPNLQINEKSKIWQNFSSTESSIFFSSITEHKNRWPVRT